MKKNMGNLDRAIRLLLMVAIAVLYYTGVISGTLAIVLGVVAGIFLLTSLVSFCPLYAALGLRSRKATDA